MRYLAGTLKDAGRRERRPAATPSRAGRPARLVLLFLIAVFASPSPAGTDFDPERNPHDHFRKASNCPKCHVLAGSKPVPSRFLPGSDGFCMGCHADVTPGRSHPVNVRPKDKYGMMKIPDDFLLDDGRMICLTCHTAHGPYVSTVRIFPDQDPVNPDSPGGTPLRYKTFYLRRLEADRGFKTLCTGCHTDL